MACAATAIGSLNKATHQPSYDGSSIKDAHLKAIPEESIYDVACTETIHKIKSLVSVENKESLLNVIDLIKIRSTKLKENCRVIFASMTESTFTKYTPQENKQLIKHLSKIAQKVNLLNAEILQVKKAIPLFPFSHELPSMFINSSFDTLDAQLLYVKKAIAKVLAHHIGIHMCQKMTFEGKEKQFYVAGKVYQMASRILSGATIEESAYIADGAQGSVTKKKLAATVYAEKTPEPKCNLDIHAYLSNRGPSAAHLEELRHSKKALNREIAILTQFPPNSGLVTPYFVAIHKNLSMELAKSSMSNGSLNSDAEVKQFLFYMLLGLSYLHSKDIAHRDIKPANILDFGGGIYKIADLGLATPMKAKPIGGTVAYLAPEVTKLVCSDYSLTDEWALGASLFQLCTRNFLHFELLDFHRDNQNPFATYIPYLRSEITQKDIDIVLKLNKAKIPPLAMPYLQCLLQVDPKKRIPAKALLFTPILKKMLSARDLAELT